MKTIGKPALRGVITIILGLVLAALAGFRVFGLDRDYLQYEHFYNLSDYEIALSRFEPGFRLLADLSHGLGLGFLGFVLLAAALSIPAKMYVISKLSHRSIVPWLYYFPYFFVLFDMTAIRLAVASTLLLVGLYCFSVGKRVLGTLFGLFSVTFHYQVLVPIVVYLFMSVPNYVVSRFKNHLLGLTVVLSGIAIYLLANYVDWNVLGGSGGWIGRYTDATAFQGAAWYQPSVIQSIVLLALGRCAIESPDRLIKTSWFVGAFGVLVYYFLSSTGSLVFRLADGLFFFNMLWLGYAAKHASAHDRSLMVLCLVSFGAYYVYLFYAADPPYLRLAERWGA